MKKLLSQGQVQSPFGLLICFMFLLLSFGLFGCSDGRVGAGNGASESAVGLWDGTVTDGDGWTYDVTGVFSPDNEICIFSFSTGFQLTGDISINGNNGTGSITGYSQEGFVFPNGDSVADGSINFNIVEKSTVSGSYSTGGDSGTFDLTYLSDLELPAFLDDVVGNWEYANGPSDWAAITIEDSGNITRTDNMGCQFTGQINIIDSDWQIFRITLTASQCAPYNGDYSGLSIIEHDQSGTFLWTIISNGQYSRLNKFEWQGP